MLEGIKFPEGFPVQPVTHMGELKRKPVMGIGVNDAPYNTSPIFEGKLIRCPYYRVWTNLFTRCYNKKYHARKPHYIGCSVHDDWHTFMSFRFWMQDKDWKGNQLDKDLLGGGSGVYGPQTCVFLSHAINNFIKDDFDKKSDLPTGVHFQSKTGTYEASISFEGVRQRIAYLETIHEAKTVFDYMKSQLALSISRDKDLEKSVADAIFKRYCK